MTSDATRARVAALEAVNADLGVALEKESERLAEVETRLDCMVDPEEHRQKLAEVERERDEAQRHLFALCGYKPGEITVEYAVETLRLGHTCAAITAELALAASQAEALALRKLAIDEMTFSVSENDEGEEYVRCPECAGLAWGDDSDDIEHFTTCPLYSSPGSTDALREFGVKVAQLMAEEAARCESGGFAWPTNDAIVDRILAGGGR